MERHFRTLKERWLYTLDIGSITSLSQFDGMLKDYMRTYNTTFHRGIDTTPMVDIPMRRSRHSDKKGTACPTIGNLV